MPKFTLNSKITVSAYTIVEEAENLDEAIKIANGRSCEFCTNWNPVRDEKVQEVWVVTDIDGTPEDIHAN